MGILLPQEKDKGHTIHNSAWNFASDGYFTEFSM